MLAAASVTSMPLPLLLLLIPCSAPVSGVLAHAGVRKRCRLPCSSHAASVCSMQVQISGVCACPGRCVGMYVRVLQGIECFRRCGRSSEMAGVRECSQHMHATHPASPDVHCCYFCCIHSEAAGCCAPCCCLLCHSQLKPPGPPLIAHSSATGTPAGPTDPHIPCRLAPLSPFPPKWAPSSFPPKPRTEHKKAKPLFHRTNKAKPWPDLDVVEHLADALWVHAPAHVCGLPHVVV